jgi:hypothetical protein
MTLGRKKPKQWQCLQEQNHPFPCSLPQLFYLRSLQFETNAIHDNGATILLCSQEVADAIGLDGESRPLGLAVFGNPNLYSEPRKGLIPPILLLHVLSKFCENNFNNPPLLQYASFKRPRAASLCADRRLNILFQFAPCPISPLSLSLSPFFVISF